MLKAVFFWHQPRSYFSHPSPKVTSQTPSATVRPGTPDPKCTLLELTLVPPALPQYWPACLSLPSGLRGHSLARTGSVGW